MSDLLVQIQVSKVSPPAWNSRVTNEDPEVWKAFKESVARDGVRTPIRVREIKTEEGKDGYELVYGSRRYKASRELDLKTIPAIVVPYTAAPTEQMKLDNMVENARENMGRRDLTTYEQGRVFADLRTAGMKLKDVASRIGVTEGHVSNLATIYLQADPVIIKEWAKGNPTATSNFLRELVAKEKDGPRQVQMFKERERLNAQTQPDAAQDEEEEEEESKEAPARNAPEQKYSVPARRYKALIRALKKARVSAITIQACEYLVGRLDSIKGVIEETKTTKET